MELGRGEVATGLGRVDVGTELGREVIGTGLMRARLNNVLGWLMLRLGRGGKRLRIGQGRAKLRLFSWHNQSICSCLHFRFVQRKGDGTHSHTDSGITFAFYHLQVPFDSCNACIRLRCLHSHWRCCSSPVRFHSPN